MEQYTGASGPVDGQDRPTVPFPDVVLHRVGDHATVTVGGRTTPDKVAETLRILRGLVDAETREVVVDLTGSWDVASLLPGLARARTDLHERGGVLRLSGVVVPELLAALLDAPLDEVFLIFDAVRRDPSHRRPLRRRGVER